MPLMRADFISEEVKLTSTPLQHSEQHTGNPICHRWRNIWSGADRQESRKRRGQKQPNFKRFGKVRKMYEFL